MGTRTLSPGVMRLKREKYHSLPPTSLSACSLYDLSGMTLLSRGRNFTFYVYRKILHCFTTGNYFSKGTAIKQVIAHYTSEWILFTSVLDSQEVPTCTYRESNTGRSATSLSYSTSWLVYEADFCKNIKSSRESFHITFNRNELHEAESLLRS